MQEAVAPLPEVDERRSDRGLQVHDLAAVDVVDQGLLALGRHEEVDDPVVLLHHGHAPLLRLGSVDEDPQHALGLGLRGQLLLAELLLRLGLTAPGLLAPGALALLAGRLLLVGATLALGVLVGVTSLGLLAVAVAVAVLGLALALATPTAPAPAAPLARLAVAVAVVLTVALGSLIVRVRGLSGIGLGPVLGALALLVALRGATSAATPTAAATPALLGLPVLGIASLLTLGGFRIGGGLGVLRLRAAFVAGRASAASASRLVLLARRSLVLLGRTLLVLAGASGRAAGPLAAGALGLLTLGCVLGGGLLASVVLGLGGSPRPLPSRAGLGLRVAAGGGVLGARGLGRALVPIGGGTTGPAPAPLAPRLRRCVLRGGRGSRGVRAAAGGAEARAEVGGRSRGGVGGVRRAGLGFRETLIVHGVRGGRRQEAGAARQRASPRGPARPRPGASPRGMRRGTRRGRVGRRWRASSSCQGRALRTLGGGGGRRLPSGRAAASCQGCVGS